MKQRFYLGIDIGGWKVRGVLWDGRRAIAAYEVPTPRTKAAFVRDILKLAEKLSRHASGRILGIGIGAAGVIGGTRVEFSPNIPYLKRFDFRTIFPAGALSVDNDARAFARAEWLLGAGRGAKRILAFTIGTGIGRAYGAGQRIKRIERLERSEAWERRYQAVRARKDDRALAEFLGGKLSAIAADYPADVVVIGGGVLGRPGFPARLVAALKRYGMRQTIRLARRGRDAAAIGAALLFS